MIETALFPYDELIREEYMDDIAADFTVQQLGGHGINSANYKLDFPGVDCPSLHLKILHQWNNNLLDKLNIFDRCHRAGVKTAQVVKTKNGEYFVEGSDFVAACFRYYNCQPYTGNSNERIAAAQELGKLNIALSKFDITVPGSELYDSLTERENSIIKQNCKGADEFGNLVSENLEWIRKLFKDLSLKLTARNIPYRLEHFDYHPDNVLIDDGRVAAIVDFDSICSVPANLSVAFASDRFSDNVRDMTEFIQAYRQTDSSLPAEQIKQIPTL
ncbi:MAG: phosphotransferase, partial [Planctomycetes bacterium]|nr:phosphotransferase [Planctomycetota bacterium]